MSSLVWLLYLFIPSVLFVYRIWGWLAGPTGRREQLAAVAGWTVTAAGLVGTGALALTHALGMAGSAFAQLARAGGGHLRTTEAGLVGHSILSALRASAPYVAVLVAFVLFLGALGEGGRYIFGVVFGVPLVFLAYGLTGGSTSPHVFFWAAAEMFAIALVVGMRAPVAGKWIARFGLLFILAMVAQSAMPRIGP